MATVASVGCHYTKGERDLSSKKYGFAGEKQQKEFELYREIYYNVS